MNATDTTSADAALQAAYDAADAALQAALQAAHEAFHAANDTAEAAWYAAFDAAYPDATAEARRAAMISVRYAATGRE